MYIQSTEVPVLAVVSAGSFLTPQSCLLTRYYFFTGTPLKVSVGKKIPHLISFLYEKASFNVSSWEMVGCATVVSKCLGK